MKRIILSAMIAAAAIIPATAQEFRFRLDDNGVALEPNVGQRQRGIERDRDRDDRRGYRGRDERSDRDERRRMGDRDRNRNCEMVTVQSRRPNGELVERRERRCS